MCRYILFIVLRFFHFSLKSIGHILFAEFQQTACYGKLIRNGRQQLRDTFQLETNYKDTNTTSIYRKPKKTIITFVEKQGTLSENKN